MLQGKEVNAKGRLLCHSTIFATVSKLLRFYGSADFLLQALPEDFRVTSRIPEAFICVMEGI
jgi:hypothetical protein